MFGPSGVTGTEVRLPDRGDLCGAGVRREISARGLLAGHRRASEEVDAGGTDGGSRPETNGREGAGGGGEGSWLYFGGKFPAGVSGEKPHPAAGFPTGDR